MNDEHVDRVVRRLAGNPQPTEDDREVTWRTLATAMRNETLSGQPLPTTSRRKRMSLLIASAAIAVLALVVFAGQMVRPPAAKAALDEMAVAARLVDPLTIRDQQYAYVRSETLTLGVVPTDAFNGQRNHPLAYFLPATLETWMSAEGTVQLRTTVGAPQFFTSTDETDYYTAGLDVIDGVGATTTETFENVTSLLDERTWPTTPGDLETALRQALPQEYDRPESVEILDLALDLIRLPSTTPSLRAAALHVIANLGLTLIERTQDGGGTFSVTYDKPYPVSITFTIDGNGQLRDESEALLSGDATLGIPPNTIISEQAHGPVQLVANLAQP